MAKVKMTVGSLEYYALLTADSLRWTAKTQIDRLAETNKAWSELPIFGCTDVDFAKVVKVSQLVLFGPAVTIFGARGTDRKVG